MREPTGTFHGFRYAEDACIPAIGAHTSVFGYDELEEESNGSRRSAASEMIDIPPEAFILFKTEPSHEQEVFLALESNPVVVETHALYGEFDLLVRVSSTDQKELTQLLMTEFRKIEGIRETQTLIAVDY